MPRVTKHYAMLSEAAPSILHIPWWAELRSSLDARKLKEISSEIKILGHALSCHYFSWDCSGKADKSRRSFRTSWELASGGSKLVWHSANLRRTARLTASFTHLIRGWWCLEETILSDVTI